jgi:allantoinase
LDAVVSGDIDIISSDHSPAPAELKETQSGDFLKAWGGISGWSKL